MKHHRFYVRYYVGHKGRFGHEFIEIIFHSDGLLEYTNNSDYKGDGEIKKQVYVTDIVLDQLKRMILESHILDEDDRNWPLPDNVGKSELEIALDRKHISFCTTKIQTLSEVAKSRDPEGLKNFYYLTADLKDMALSLINMHFKMKPILY
ncbi:hypothetical protein FDP41_013174 [Naegleria fowleri]|uniref:Mago nashi n=1 Tax=Naegleria fowleri TaxID=5763 RepID=A0A6A5C162_NAEFO|nr:uncharacterized protein FDP41_013174 [Naegleria fowleri]KAF0980691.1 hypothetical protein FDP41_013174 [Naegleria fowleri]